MHKYIALGNAITKANEIKRVHLNIESKRTIDLKQ